MNDKVGAIILAAGNGERFGGEKQFYILEDKPLWQHVYDKILTLINKENVVVVGVDISGGVTRSGSVFNGLKYLMNNDLNRVIILEAARPLVTIEQIKILIKADSPSVSFVLPCVNTVIYRDGRYINRNELYELLTPQAFDYQKLFRAYKSGMFKDMTDETRVMFEYYDIKPKLIETTANLLKVTYQRDIPIVKELLRNNKF